MFGVFSLNEFQRECALAEKEYQINCAEVAYLESMVNAKLAINRAKSELKVMTESTKESAIGDLIWLYNEAAKEAEQQAESVFKKMQNGIVRFFVTVWNSIQKLVTKVDTEAYKKLQASNKTFKFPFDIKKVTDTSEKVVNTIMSVPDIIDDDETKNGAVIGKIVGIVGVGGASIAGATAVIKKLTSKEEATEVEVKAGEALNCYEKLKNAFKKLPEKFKKFSEGKKNGDEGNNGEEGSGNNEKTASGLMKGLSNIGQAIGSVISKALDVIARTLGITGNRDVQDENETNPNGGTQDEPSNGNNAEKDQPESNNTPSSTRDEKWDSHETTELRVLSVFRNEMTNNNGTVYKKVKGATGANVEKLADEFEASLNNKKSTDKELNEKYDAFSNALQTAGITTKQIDRNQNTWKLESVDDIFTEEDINLLNSLL